MYVPRLLWTLFATLLLLGFPCRDGVYAQTTQQHGKITFGVVSQTALPQLGPRDKRIMVVRNKEQRWATLTIKEGRRILSIQDGPQVSLPRNLPALIARDGSMILQYGDERDLSHPRVTNLHWLDAEGNEVAKLEGYYDGIARVAVSDDGFTAVTGRRVENGQGKVIALFNRKGERLWERSVGEGREVHSKALVTAKGARVVVVTTDGDRPNKDHRLLILDAQGKELSTIAGMEIIHRMVAVDDEHLFVEAKNQHALIELSRGTQVWSIESRLRLVSPRAAAMGPDGKVLFLLVIEWPGKPQPTYQWRLQALDVDNGQELGIWDLPKEMSSTWADVFGRITEDRIEILFGPDQLSISWSR